MDKWKYRSPKAGLQQKIEEHVDAIMDHSQCNNKIKKKKKKCCTQGKLFSINIVSLIFITSPIPEEQTGKCLDR